MIGSQRGKVGLETLSSKGKVHGGVAMHLD